MELLPGIEPRSTVLTRYEQPPSGRHGSLNMQGTIMIPLHHRSIVFIDSVDEPKKISTNSFLLMLIVNSNVL